MVARRFLKLNANRVKAMEDISLDISHLIIYHISLLFDLKQHYMALSDYIDHLNMGYTPPEDSQYWVAPFIQDIFANLITKFRPDITEYIKTTISMHLDFS